MYISTAKSGCTQIALGMLLLLIMGLSCPTGLFAQQSSLQKTSNADSKARDPWKAQDLMAPSELARLIESGSKSEQPIILSVGPAALIKGSRDIGPASQAENLAQLKKTLEKLPKDQDIVIYCGCCPFTHCPNVRPAFNLLKEMHFTHAKLLNLEHNIRTDWIDKGFATQQ